jgi:hypothetical protein
LARGHGDGRQRLDEGLKATLEEIGLGCLEGNSASPGFDERFFARSLKRSLKIRLEFDLDWLE